MNIPPGFTTVFPYIFASNPDTYLEFLERGLGGTIQSVQRAPDGSLANAQIRFGDTVVMVSDAKGWDAPTRATYYLYVENADAAMAKAVSAGGKIRSAVKDQPYWGSSRRHYRPLRECVVDFATLENRRLLTRCSCPFPKSVVAKL